MRILALVLLAACGASQQPRSATVRCHERICLDAYEGQQIEIDGTLLRPRHLVLGDGTRIVLPRDARLPPTSRVRVRGRVYTRQTPAWYGIVQQLAVPEVLELVSVTPR
ncbi:MAG TPA: hypothetical protein VK427_02425 [Kofleriaceae bacterium]|nr:hypothetical protein [Kofleriaceae bacterium]